MEISQREIARGRKRARPTSDLVRPLDWAKISFWMAVGVIASLVLFLNLFLIYQILANAFKSIDDYNGAGAFSGMGTNVFLLPRQFSLSSFAYFFHVAGLPRAFLNNIILSVFSIIILEVIGSATSLVLAQYPVRCTEWIVKFLIGAQAIPIVMTMITTFRVTRSLQWLDTYQGAIVAFSAQSLPFVIFLFYSYYLSLPKELIEAAEVDGASFPDVLFRVVLPMSGPIVATVGILIFTNVWATYLIGLIILRKEDMHILSMVIQNMEIALRLMRPVFYAAFVIVSLPMLVIARWAQRYIAAGMLAGAVKE